LILIIVLAGTGSAPAHRLAGAGHCPILPKTSPWNTRVDKLPASPRSRVLMSRIGLDAPAHAGFGSVYGMPVNVVSRRTKKFHFHLKYSDSDHVRYPIPRGLRIENPPDRHALMLDKSSCKLYELFDVDERHGSWYAGAGAVWNLRKNQRRAKGATSADAAGLPILPGLARVGDLDHHSIDHALRFTAPRTRSAFVYPASPAASDSGDRRRPAMGTRIRLKKSVSLAGLGPQARMVAIALKRYGAILADNGDPLYFSGVPSRKWDDLDLEGLMRYHGSDFEVVDPHYVKSAR
jgi:hypothetical protein